MNAKSKYKNSCYKYSIATKIFDCLCISLVILYVVNVNVVIVKVFLFFFNRNNWGKKCVTFYLEMKNIPLWKPGSKRDFEEGIFVVSGIFCVAKNNTTEYLHSIVELIMNLKKVICFHIYKHFIYIFFALKFTRCSSVSAI